MKLEPSGHVHGRTGSLDAAVLAIDGDGTIAVPETPPAATKPPRPRLRLVLGALALVIFSLWLGARLGPLGAVGPGSSIDQGSWLPTPTPAEAYVGGAVAHPGLYPLTPNARLADVLRQAGGAMPTADLTHLNLAAPVRDGQTIIIPRRRSGGCATT